MNRRYQKYKELRKQFYWHTASTILGWMRTEEQAPFQFEFNESGFRTARWKQGLLELDFKLNPLSDPDLEYLGMFSSQRTSNAILNKAALDNQFDSEHIWFIPPLLSQDYREDFLDSGRFRKSEIDLLISERFREDCDRLYTHGKTWFQCEASITLSLNGVVIESCGMSEIDSDSPNYELIYIADILTKEVIEKAKTTLFGEQ